MRCPRARAGGTADSTGSVPDTCDDDDDDGVGSADLEGVVGWDEFFPSWMLAFAGDGCGGWFCLGVRGAGSGKVFYVSHDLDQGDPRRLAPVADSFGQFARKWKVPKRT